MFDHAYHIALLMQRCFGYDEIIDAGTSLRTHYFMCPVAMLFLTYAIFLIHLLEISVSYPVLAAFLVSN